MKIGKKSLKMSSGEVKSFGSEKKRNNFEKMAQTIKHNPEFKKKLKQRRIGNEYTGK